LPYLIASALNHIKKSKVVCSTHVRDFHYGLLDSDSKLFLKLFLYACHLLSIPLFRQTRHPAVAKMLASERAPA
jgi:hypothetical protein